MKNNKILLIAIGVSMSDIRTAMALQKLNENDYIIIDNEQDAKVALELRSCERHLRLSAPLASFEYDPLQMTQVVTKKRHKERKDVRFNVRPRDIVGFRTHPQMVRRA